MTDEDLYEVAKSGQWDRVLAAMSRDSTVAAACSRYVRPTSGWTFLHQAAYFGHEMGARAVVGLGGTLDARSKDGESPIDVAEKRGHNALAQLLRDAVQRGPWAPVASADVRPSSNAWREAEPRRTQLGLTVGYAGATIQIPPGSRYYVDSFERILVGWHGTFDPPCGMDGSPIIDGETMGRRLAIELEGGT
jgi:hypothetical protein